MMHTSIYLSRSLALLVCIVFPLYLAIRGSASLSDIALVLSSLSERAEALHFKLTPSLAASPAPISKSLPDGLAHCINSFEQYPVLAEQVLQRKHVRYSKQTPAQKAISSQLGYSAHFEKARKGIEVNARFSEKIAQIARRDYHTGPRTPEVKEVADFGVVDLAFAHLSRDWSTQGEKERQAVFPPVLSGLEQHFGGSARGNKVLVPGSGMGRLASDIADLGAFHHTSLSLLS
jgi:hypothetical protein